MTQGFMPLPQTDYQTMNCSHNEFFEVGQKLPDNTKLYVVNATHRLAEVDWITLKLEEEVRSGKVPVFQEGLLSLLVYLLLTCADTLGHIYSTPQVRQRFRAFFQNLPQEAKRNLTDNIFTWRIDSAELVRSGLKNAVTNRVCYPSRQQILNFVQSLTPDKRLEAVVEFLYGWRNYYTHESEHPQLGYHPNLSIMQRQRLNIPNAATFGELDRLHPMYSDNYAYFTYYETEDVIATIRWSVVRGLGQIVGLV